MNEHMSPIPSRIYNVAVDGHVCGPEDIDFGQKVVHLIKYDKDGNEVSFESQVTQANKIYVIHDDFVLSSNVTIPTDCVLKFEGGSINGTYTLTGNNTQIEALDVVIFKSNVIIGGTWNCQRIVSTWFGDITSNDRIKQLINLCSDNIFNHIIVEKGNHQVTAPESMYDGALNIKSNTLFTILGNIVLIPNSNTNYGIINIYDKENITITGDGQVIGDKDTHIGSTGEWGHCVRIIGSNNITINNIKCHEAWGDGIYIGKGTAFSSGIIISNVESYNNRRQGITVGYSKNVIIENCYCHHISGTAPQAGIDIECDVDENIDNVSVVNSRIDNASNGICVMAIDNMPIKNISICNNLINVTETGIQVVSKSKEVACINNNVSGSFGLVLTCDNSEFKNNTIIGTTKCISVYNCENVLVENNKLSGLIELLYNPIISIFKNNAIIGSFSSSNESEGAVFENNKISITQDSVLYGNVLRENNIEINGTCLFGNFKAIINNTIKTISDSENISPYNFVNVYNIINNHFIIDNNSKDIYGILNGSFNSLMRVIENTFELLNGRILHITSSNITIEGRNNNLIGTCYLDLYESATILTKDAMLLHPTSGTTADRPTLKSQENGFRYFDMDLAKPIYWNGTAWVDATGTPV